MSAQPGLLRLVPDTSGAHVTATGPLVHLCPHVPETDAGTVTVSWRCASMTVELHSLTAYLTSWARQALSSEEVTEQIVRDLEALDGIEEVTAESTWRTAGLAVTVRA